MLSQWPINVHIQSQKTNTPKTAGENYSKAFHLLNTYSFAFLNGCQAGPALIPLKKCSERPLWLNTQFSNSTHSFFLVQISPFAPHPSIFTAVDCVKWPHFDKSFSQLRFRASYYLIFFFLSSQIMSFVFSFLLLFLTWRTLIMFLTSVCFSLLAPLVAF